MTKTTPCIHCHGTRWTVRGLCRHCEYEAPLPAPHLFWDETIGVYGWEDGDEQGVCQHATTTDTLDLLGDDKVPTLKQLHQLGDDWGFRMCTFVDKRGREHRLHLENYKSPSCFEEYGGLSDETAAALERIQGAVLAGSAQ